MVTRITTLLALYCALATTLFSQTFDTDFQPFITRPGDVSELAALPDGRFIAAGSFTWANRAERTNIARFLPDGSLDESFDPAIGFSIMALAVQPDGKVLIGGAYMDEDAPEGITVIRLNTDGSLDDSFQAGFAPDGSFADIEVESTGTILAGGSFNRFDGQPTQGVVRLSSTGSLQGSIPLNTSGVVFVSSLMVQDNGRFAVGGTYNEEAYLSYHEYNGAPVAGFNFSITLPGTTNILVGIRDLAQDSQGRIVFSTGTFLIRYAVGILNLDGSYAGWNYVFGIPMSIAVGPNDNIFVSGDFEGVSAVHAFDPASGLSNYPFGIGADGLVRKVVVHPAGGFLAAGHFSAFDGQPHLGIARLNGSGAPVAAFGAALERLGVVRSIERSGADKVYISGEFAMVGDTYSPNIARLLVDSGDADPDFNNPGISYRNEVRRITLDGQGRILAAGTNLDNAESAHESPLMRLLPSGAFDPAFQPNPDTYPVGRITKIQPLANGRLLVIGDFSVFDSGIAASKVALYNADGSLVESFSSRIQVGAATELLRLNDGSILLGGRDIRYDGAAPRHIIRLTTTLNPDPAFQAADAILCTNGCRFKFSEQEDGKILVGGVFRTDPAQVIPFRMVRLEANGALDNTFQLDGAFDNNEPYVDGGVRKMLPMPGGRILTVGLFDSLGLAPTPSMVLLEEDGRVADNFPGLSFERQFLFDAALLDDGGFLVGGLLSGGSRPMQTGLARVSYRPQPSATISGRITTPGGLPVEGVEVGIVGQPSGNMLTDFNGSYTFTDPQPGSDYTVMPMLNTEHLNGVTTLDLMLISRHILGNSRFDDPYRIIAADVDNSQALSTLDLIGIQKLILGRATEFDNFSWRFVDASYTFPNPANPWQEPFPEMISLTGLPNGGVQGVDFIAIKIGDVNGSATPGPQPVLGRSAFNLRADDRALEAGKRIEVPIRIGTLSALRAFQFTLQFDPSALSMEGIDYGLVQEEGLGFNFLDKGWITASCYRLPEDVDPETPLFTLAFRVHRGGYLQQVLRIGSGYTPAEAYDSEGQTYRPELSFRPVSAALAAQPSISPNPFSEQATLSFDMDSPGEVVLLIYAPDGRLLHRWSEWCGAGRRDVQLSGESLPEGVLYYTLLSGPERMSGTMVVRR